MPKKSTYTRDQEQAGRMAIIGILSFFFCPMISLGLMVFRHTYLQDLPELRLFLALVGLLLSLYGIIGGAWLTIRGVIRYEQLRKKTKS